MPLHQEFESRLTQLNNHQKHVALIYLIEYTDLIKKAFKIGILIWQSLMWSYEGLPITAHQRFSNQNWGERFVVTFPVRMIFLRSLSVWIKINILGICFIKVWSFDLCVNSNFSVIILYDIILAFASTTSRNARSETRSNQRGILLWFLN